MGHVRELAPTWEELYRENNENLNVGTVDCTTTYGKLLCKNYEVKGFPALLYFPGASSDSAAKYARFRGLRNKEDLVDFALNGGWQSADTMLIPKNEGKEYW